MRVCCDIEMFCCAYVIKSQSEATMAKKLRARLEIFVPILAKFRVPVSPVLFFEILRGHIASPLRAKIGQALSPCERELVLINNVLRSAIKATKKELFIGTLHALSSNILRLALCRRRERFLRGS